MDVGLYALNGQWAEKTATALVFQYIGTAWQLLTAAFNALSQTMAPYAVWLIQFFPKILLISTLFYLLRGPRFYELEWNEEVLQFKKSWTPWGLAKAQVQVIETPTIKAMRLQHRLFHKVLYIELTQPKESFKTLSINCIPTKDARRLVQKINGYSAKRQKVYRNQRAKGNEETPYISLSTYSKII